MQKNDNKCTKKNNMVEHFNKLLNVNFVEFFYMYMQKTYYYVKRQSLWKIRITNFLIYDKDHNKNNTKKHLYIMKQCEAFSYSPKSCY